jgi:hypothetical protein
MHLKYSLNKKYYEVFCDITILTPLKSACYLLQAGFFLDLFSESEDGGNKFLQNVS